MQNLICQKCFYNKQSKKFGQNSTTEKLLMMGGKAFSFPFWKEKYIFEKYESSQFLNLSKKIYISALSSLILVHIVTPNAGACLHNINQYLLPSSVLYRTLLIFFSSYFHYDYLVCSTSGIEQSDYSNDNAFGQYFLEFVFWAETRGKLSNNGPPSVCLSFSIFPIKAAEF